MNVYILSEDVFYFGLRSKNSIVDVHETLESAEKEYVEYLLKDIRFLGYREENRDQSFFDPEPETKIQKMTIVFSKWFGLCKRIVTVEPHYVHDDHRNQSIFETVNEDEDDDDV